jgi:hypothetical protein
LSIGRGEGFIAQKTYDGKEYLAWQSTPGITEKKKRQEKSRPHRPVGLAATDETAKGGIPAAGITVLGW